MKMPKVKIQSKYGLFIDGKWKDSSDGATFKTITPTQDESLSNCVVAKKQQWNSSETIV